MTDIRTSWIFGYHGYSDIIDIRTSRIFGHHGNLDIMHTRTSWIFRHHGYMDIRDIQMSWIFGCLDIVDILGDTPFSGKSVFPEKKIFEALSMQSCTVLPNFTFEALALQVPGGHFLIFSL